MKLLFVHNNFPAQYRNLASALAREPGVEMVAIGAGSAQPMPSVRLLKYALANADVSGTHPFARRFDLECRRAEQVLYSLSSLAASGFKPDVILAHPGWGETLPLRMMFPRAKLIVYCEFFYGAEGRDLGFDPEFPEPGLDGHIGLQLKNATTLLALADCDLGISPTRWQHSTFPTHYQSKIEIVHEGVDTDLVRPDPQARLQLPNGRLLTRADEVITFVARNLEPLRGYHVFMRALPEILARRPNAQVVIIGNDGLSYGLAPPPNTSWKSVFLKEVASRLDLRRVHFLGRVPHRTFLDALQVSSAHVYLTYPFVLSWSMLEAMSAGCLVIGSETTPVQEVIRPDHNGLLVPFFAIDELVERVVEVLQGPARFQGIREAARQHVVEHYDAARVCVPRMRSLLGDEPPDPSPARGYWPGFSPPVSNERRSPSAPRKANTQAAARKAPKAKSIKAESKRVAARAGK
ncbi:glycosyltransferase family 4 protein [Bradyrhizobium jicamae]|uniref:glycosyltransferase family 4 protein n=1 Tax=Bradyrhizobium jicamae TaxID=280332 RepID=UPI001BA50D7F|nr:glycosyltransferase family 4 protein [Bradyrhizobium jicamae]MBR0750733.1 glycosyltransferase family 4 protein [Bradyrhizobium jicamae]